MVTLFRFLNTRPRWRFGDARKADGSFQGMNQQARQSIGTFAEVEAGRVSRSGSKSERLGKEKRAELKRRQGKRRLPSEDPVKERMNEMPDAN